jgi:hypothetical protein
VCVCVLCVCVCVRACACVCVCVRVCVCVCILSRRNKACCVWDVCWGGLQVHIKETLKEVEEDDLVE